MRLSGSFLSTQQLLRDAPASLSPRRPQLSIATAIVFYHRFFARESYANYDKFQVPCYSRTASSSTAFCRAALLARLYPACLRARASHYISVSATARVASPFLSLSVGRDDLPLPRLQG